MIKRKKGKEPTIIQEKNRLELRSLFRRREVLRHKLKDHFCLPVIARNYKEFDFIVIELDEIRKKIQIAMAKER